MILPFNSTLGTRRTLFLFKANYFTILFTTLILLNLVLLDIRITGVPYLISDIKLVECFPPLFGYLLAGSCPWLCPGRQRRPRVSAVPRAAGCPSRLPGQDVRCCRPCRARRSCGPRSTLRSRAHQLLTCISHPIHQPPCAPGTQPTSIPRPCRPGSMIPITHHSSFLQP